MARSQVLFRRRAEHGHRRAEHRSPMPLDELAEGGFVPGPRSRDQLVIAHTAV
jgi:hypothetical protein